MSVEALLKSLEQLPDPSFVEGTQKLSEPLAIALPDGDVAALDDKLFVKWLVARSEDAPFGDKGETKLDSKVRRAKRLRVRGKAEVAGFDPAAVLPGIEAALSPRFHLDARLEDIIVYEKGGKFARHKDTPRTAELVGTLVVGLPVAHEGGQFAIVDGGKRHVVDWSGTPDRNTVRWVALFSDLDHEVEQVKSGARVTLVYSLSRSSRPRADLARDKKLAQLHEAIGTLEIKAKEPLLIPCTRLIVTDGKQPQALDTLRGTDREIAEAFVEDGFGVAVRACLVGDSDEGGSPTFPNMRDVYAITRLKTALPDKVVEDMDEVVSFSGEVDMEEYEGEEEIGGTTLGEYVLDMVWRERCLIRKRAAASVIYEGMYSETGYFGNEASFGHIYALAAIEISARSGKPKAKPAAKPKAKPAAKLKAKPAPKPKATPKPAAKPKPKATKGKGKR